MKGLKKHKNFHSILIGLGLVLFWRGLWGLLDKYLFPDNEILSYGISIFIGLIILFLNDLKLDELE